MDTKTYIPMPVENCTLNGVLDAFAAEEDRERKITYAEAVCLILSEHMRRTVITADDIAHVIAQDSGRDEKDVPTDWAWEHCVDAVDALRSAYPCADATPIVVTSRDVTLDRTATLCSECTAYLVNGERPDAELDAESAAWAADLDAFEASAGGRGTWMHAGTTAADYTHTCECCGQEAWDWTQAEIWEL
jgi:hypothetical protein